MLYLSSNWLWPNISIYVLSYFYQFYPDISYDYIFIVDTGLVLFNILG